MFTVEITQRLVHVVRDEEISSSFLRDSHCKSGNASTHRKQRSDASLSEPLGKPAADNELVTLGYEASDVSTIQQYPIVSARLTHAPNFVKHLEHRGKEPVSVDGDEKMIGRIFNNPLHGKVGKLM